MPPPAIRLFEEAKLRRLARQAGVPYVGYDKEEKRLVFKLHAWDMKMVDRALRGMPEVRDVRILNDETLTFGLTLKAKTNESALDEMTRNLLDPLAKFRKKFGKPKEGRRGKAVSAS